jgi:Rrf2 family protein
VLKSSHSKPYYNGPGSPVNGKGEGCRWPSRYSSGLTSPEPRLRAPTFAIQDFCLHGHFIAGFIKRRRVALRPIWLSSENIFSDGRLNILRKFLEAILLELRNGGILQSRKGKEGGYLLDRSPDTIIFGKIMRFIDGSFAGVSCIRRDSYARCDDCPDEKTCVIRCVMKQVRDATAQIVDQTTLDQLVAKAK